jgi:hypothetical protein
MDLKGHSKSISETHNVYGGLIGLMVEGRTVVAFEEQGQAVLAEDAFEMGGDLPARLRSGQRQATDSMALAAGFRLTSSR